MTRVHRPNLDFQREGSNAKMWHGQGLIVTMTASDSCHQENTEL